MFASDHWTYQRRRRFMIGLHMPDYDQLPEADWSKQPKILANVDPRGLAKSLHEAEVEVFYYYAKCHFGNTYYPSRVPGAHVHSAVRQRDIFKEFTEACLEFDIIPGMVYEFSDRRLPQDHPDWCHRNAANPEKGIVEITDEVEGARIAGGCINGPYGDYALAQILEVVKNYPIQVCYADFLGLFGSFHAWICPYCNAKFRQAFGLDFPGTARLSTEQLIAYRAWRYQQYDEYAKKLRSAIKAERPEVLFTHNFFGIADEPGQTRWDMAEENCDFMSKDVFSLRSGTLHISWRTRALRECSLKAPAEILLDSMSCLDGDWFTPKPYAAYRAELWTARCAGLAPCGSVLPLLDGAVNTFALPVMEQLASLYQEQKQYEPWLKDMRPLAETAILRSRQSIENPLPDTDNSGAEHAEEFYGWCEVLCAAHHLWTVIQDHHLTDEFLSRFTTLILPGASCLDEKQCAAVRRFAVNGGRLVVSGKTSLFDSDGKPRKNFALTDVLNASFLDYAPAPDFEHPTVKQSYLNLLDTGLLDRARHRQPLIYFNYGQILVEAHEGAKVLGEIARKESLTMTFFVTPTSYPGLIESRCGKGHVFYAAGNLGQQYSLYGQSNLKHLMAALLEKARGNKGLLRLEAPESMELLAHRQPDSPARLIVSMINQFSSVTRTQGARKDIRKHDMVDVMPVLSEATLTILPPAGRQVKRVVSVPDGAELKISSEGKVKLRDIDVLTMLAVEFDSEL